MNDVRFLDIFDREINAFVDLFGRFPLKVEYGYVKGYLAYVLGIGYDAKHGKHWGRGLVKM